jgi:hypothetical protein
MNITVSSDNPETVVVSLPAPLSVSVIGIPGPAGPPGPEGPPGEAGAVDGVWLLDTTTISVEPGPGAIGFVGADNPETITELYIHEIDADGINRHGSLSSIQSAILRLYLESDPRTAIWVFSIDNLMYYGTTHVYACAVSIIGGLGESFPADNSRFVVRIFPQLGGGGLIGYDYDYNSFPITALTGSGATKLFNFGDGNAAISVDINDSQFYNDGSNEGKLTLTWPVPEPTEPDTVLTVDGEGNLVWVTSSDGGGGLTVHDYAGTPIPTTVMRGDGNVKYTDLGGATGVYADYDAATMRNVSGNKLGVKYPLPVGGAINDVLTKTGSADGVVGWQVAAAGGATEPLRLGPVGRWVAATSGTVSHQPYGAGAGIIRLYRVYIDVPFDATGFQVETGVAGSNFRIGIYNTSPTDGRPTSLVVPQLQVDTSTSGTKFATHSRVPPGWYWFGSVPSVSLTIRAQVNQASPNIPTSSGALSMLQNSWYISAASMPDPFPSSGEGGSGDVALFYVRIAA